MRMRAEAGGDAGAGERHYHPVPLDSIAPVFLQAVIAGEDNRFWSHGGLDFVELRRALGYRRPGFAWDSPGDLAALLGALGHAWSQRDELRGASTITQQLAKNLYLSPSRNPFRKFKEAVTAWRLESALGKRRILELYANVVELGPGLWGVGAASRRYFDRPPGNLSTRQAAALAGALPFPLLSNPAFHPARMRWRQSLILRRLRGEPVEVPRLAEELRPSVAESISHTPGMDSLLDSLRAPVETLPGP